MGVIGTFLSLGWIGGNLIKDAISNAEVGANVNKILGPQIEYRNGNYYSTRTGRRVFKTFETDYVTGEIWETWVDAKTQIEVYSPGREKFEEKQKKVIEEINKAKDEKDAIWLQEAIDNNRRYAKVILPYKPGATRVEEGYIDRKEKTSGSPRKYYVTWPDVVTHKMMIYEGVFRNGYWHTGPYWTMSYEDEKYDKTIK